MTYFADLTPSGYGRSLPIPKVHIGWLDKDYPFPVSNADPVFVAALYVLTLKHSVRQTRGFHLCPYCSNDSGSAEIEVLGKGVIYVAPTLIAHYVDIHLYSPPIEFYNAVLEWCKRWE